MADSTSLLGVLGRLARRGGAAAPPAPRRRRLVLLQVDGLSGERLERALSTGEMPHLAARIKDGKWRMMHVRAGTAPSTPVFQAGLLYGCCGGLPGFGWYDRALGRIVRMDQAEDIAAVERDLADGAAQGPRLLDGGISYGTIWPGGATETFFNVLHWGNGTSPTTASRTLGGNLFDVASSLTTAGAIATKLWFRLLLELAVGAGDMVRFFRRQHTMRFEWRFLYMRLFTSVILRDIITHGAALDVLRGVPVIYADYLGYDEYAHRRGPDSGMALWNLRGIDDGIEKIARAVEAVPEYGYEVYIMSDHGQSATVPFERSMGQDLCSFVMERVAGAASPGVDREAVELAARARELRFWAHTQSSWAKAIVEPYVRWFDRRAEERLGAAARSALEPIEVVTGGLIAHLYLSREQVALPMEEITRRWPRLVDDLAACKAVGLVVGRGSDGPVLFYRGQRYRLADAERVARLEPFRTVGYELLASHLRAAMASVRTGDLVLYGAFAEAGNTAFDFEFGSHGGIHPEELDQFLVYPANVAVRFDEAGAGSAGVGADAFHRFFRERHHDVVSDDPVTDVAA